MRYTTAIDITEVPAVWRSQSACRLYLWACMKCGYHDQDRDYLDMSFRQMAIGTGLTLSAVRCALQTLQKAKLITRQGEGWMVTKWIPESKPGKRPAAAQSVKHQALEEERLQQERRRAIQDEETRRLQLRKQVLREATLDELEQLQDIIKQYGSSVWRGYTWTSAMEVSVFIAAKKRSIK